MGIEVPSGSVNQLLFHLRNPVCILHPLHASDMCSSKLYPENLIPNPSGVVHDCVFRVRSLYFPTYLEI